MTTTEQKMIPEGLEAHYEHHRRVVIAADGHPPTEQGPILLVSDPVPMRSWEWRKAEENGFAIEVLPRGGWTICQLVRPGVDGEPDELVSQGVAQCSLTDNYVKASGRVKALGDAISIMNTNDPFHKPVAA